MRRLPAAISTLQFIAEGFLHQVTLFALRSFADRSQVDQRCRGGHHRDDHASAPVKNVVEGLKPTRQNGFTQNHHHNRDQNRRARQPIPGK
jgi:hypothetical protein